MSDTIDEQRTARESTGYQNGTPEFIESFDTKLKRLQRRLDVSFIDFRVGRMGLKGDKAWATLLAYKDARVDMVRLDEVFGGEWANTFHRDSKGVLQCEISIFNRDLNQWVSRSSNGVPSNFESEKGEYSDAFKRAGFMWGIGRELYQFPMLFVYLFDDEFKKSGNKVEPTFRFKPNEWMWSLNWDHVDQSNRKTGLIHAKWTGSSGYRIKPTAMIPPQLAPKVEDK